MNSAGSRKYVSIEKANGKENCKGRTHGLRTFSFSTAHVPMGRPAVQTTMQDLEAGAMMLLFRLLSSLIFFRLLLGPEREKSPFSPLLQTLQFLPVLFCLAGSQGLSLAGSPRPGLRAAL